MADEMSLEDHTVSELLDIADERGVDVPKSAKKQEIIEALETVDAPLAEEGPQEEPAVDAPPEPDVDSFAVEAGDNVAVLTINDDEFVLTRDQVAGLRRELDVAFAQLH